MASSNCVLRDSFDWTLILSDGTRLGVNQRFNSLDACYSYWKRFYKDRLVSVIPNDPLYNQLLIDLF